MERNTGTSSAETATQLMKAFGIYNMWPNLGEVLKRVNAEKAYEKAKLESKIFLNARLGVPIHDEFETESIIDAEYEYVDDPWEESDER